MRVAYAPTSRGFQHQRVAGWHHIPAFGGQIMFVAAFIHQVDTSGRTILAAFPAARRVLHKLPPDLVELVHEVPVEKALVVARRKLYEALGMELDDTVL